LEDVCYIRTRLITRSTTSDAESQIKDLRVIYCISHVKTEQKLEIAVKLLLYFCKSDRLLLSILPYFQGLLT